MNRKKILTLILSLALILSLVGCGKEKSNVSGNEKKSAESLNEQSQTEENTSKESQSEVNTKKTEADKRTEVQGVSAIYPSNWLKKNIKGEDIYLLDDKGTSVNLVVESMQGHSEEDYNKASDIDVKTNLPVDNIKVKEQEFNNKKARITYYVQKHQDRSTPTYQVTFLNNNMSYIFTLAGVEKISDENMTALKNMLNTIKFEN